MVKRKVPIDKINSISLRYVHFLAKGTRFTKFFHASPYQDDFLILHVRDEYDTVLETVLKTEFLTLLSEKYMALTRSQLSFTFNRRWALNRAFGRH